MDSFSRVRRIMASHKASPVITPRTARTGLGTSSPESRVIVAPPNGLTLSRANRTRDRSTYDDEAAVGVGCSVELGGSFRKVVRLRAGLHEMLRREDLRGLAKSLRSARKWLRARR